MRSLALIFTLTLMAQVSTGQNQIIKFQNSMQTPAKMFITPVGTTDTREVDLNVGLPAEFVFSGTTRFNIQVIPDDERTSGFRFLNVNLSQLATKARGPITLNGAFAPGERKLICYKRRCRSRRCRCCWVTKRGERIAVGLEARLTDGTFFQVESPKMSYTDVMGY
jgi:hypothetical protein